MLAIDRLIDRGENMRVNIYAEELTERLEFLEKTVEDPDGAKHTFYGLRFWLKFPGQPWWVHRKVSTPDGTPGDELDDDSTAVTFWGPTPEALQELFTQAVGAIVTERSTIS